MNGIFTNENLQSVITTINSNVEAIESLRKKEEGMDLHEAAQLFLMDKYKLSQTEAMEIACGLKEGIDEYQKSLAKVKENYEETVRKSIEDSLNSLSDEERVKYLSSMLTVLKSASVPNCDQNTIDALMEENSAKPQDELIDEIVGAMDGLSVEMVASLAKDVNVASVASLAEAIEKNTDEYRFMAAVQLYVAQRDKLLKLKDVSTDLNPQMLGALASASVDAMLATAELQNGEITLSKWQQILKYILGAVFVVAFVYIAVMLIASAAVAVMLSILSVIGTSIAAIIFSFVLVIPVLKYGMDFAVKNMMLLLEKLSPIYDKVVSVVTNCLKSVFDAVCSWIKNRFKNKEEQVAEQPIQEPQPNTGNTTANPANENNLALA